METHATKEARLQVLRNNQAQRLSVETPDGRLVRLQILSTNQAQRLSNETSTARDARQEQERIRANQRRYVETHEQRGARLQGMRAFSNQQSHSSTPQQLPLFEQPSVRDKMLKFHSEIATIDSPKCSVCLEKFPGMKLHSSSTQCMHCHRDKHISQVYSAGNNMDPGPVPSELKVSNSA